MMHTEKLSSVYEKHDHFYFIFKRGVADEMKEASRVVLFPTFSSILPYRYNSSDL